jgi:hypothetical protein
MPRGLLHAETGCLRHLTSHAEFVADEFTHVRGSIRERLGTLRESVPPRDIGERQGARHGVANRMIVSRGVRAGAIIPYHVLDSNPGCRHVPLS